MTQQLEINFAAPPAPDEQDVAMLVDWLYRHPGFHTARQIASALTGTDDRKVRSLAEHANGCVVSGPGSHGYCHAAHCPPETMRRVVLALESQARRMLARASKIRDAGHRYLHAPA